MDARSFPNPYLYQDYSKDPSTPFNSAGQLTPDFVNRVINKIKELLQLMETGLKSADPRDFTVYTGWSGIALLYLHLSEVFGDQSFLIRAQEYASKALHSLNKRDVTFLCGDAGPYAVAAVILHRLGSHKEADECISRVLQMHPSVLKLESRLPDELLYGRMGYLYTLLFINKCYNAEKVSFRCIQEVCEVVIKSGENFAAHKRMQNQSPLMYEWYGEYYVGPAHGLAGIYYYLMQPQCNVSTEKLQTLIGPSVEFVRHLRYPSGNYPACIGDNRDLLVHWCHGAPGIIYMLTQAYKLFKASAYLADAAQCAEICWQRGLLKKGYGICHGVAGNAYSFLALYNLTHDLKYLYRACKFAEWCMDYGEHGCRTPDTPFSLFEGLAGTIYFLADLLDPAKARFPAFEI
ncbi:glutathione S-transferase LANCL1 [Bufo bufo]|uniref:glutathione S-transferase LANCL1 n=1 Tax=Bufo bufo TaxID=8384 RepID=UPI001ABDA00C|nr:glutathione S-transferase LANCL1 [Bufo bufo]XP_040296705.1 glutathione S-transferase LANCL1 [Bufo bufo]